MRCTAKQILKIIKYALQKMKNRVDGYALGLNNVSDCVLNLCLKDLR